LIDDKDALAAATLTFRMDDRRQRLVVNSDRDDGAAFFGWELADASALEATARHQGCRCRFACV
jgi:hypothetical protein